MRWGKLEAVLFVVINLLVASPAIAQIGGLSFPGPGPRVSSGGGGNVPTYVNGNFAQIPGTVFGGSVTKSAALSGSAIIITMCGSITGAGELIAFSDNAGNTYTARTPVENLSIGYTCAQGVASGVTGSPTIFTATSNILNNNTMVMVDEFSNVLASSPVDGTGEGQSQTNPGTGANAVTSGAFTTSASGDLIYGFSVSIGSLGMTNGSGFTGRQSAVSTWYSQSFIQSSPGSTACTMTDSGATDTTITTCLALKHS